MITLSKLNKQKKGIVLPETLKIIIGVLCILLLIYLAVKLYGIFTRSSELEQATATAEAIVGKANALKDGETAEYFVVGPKDWRIIPLTKEKKLCICPKASDIKKQLSICNSEGFCKEFDKEIHFLNNFYTCENVGVLTYEGITGCFSLSKVPQAVFLSNKNGIIDFKIDESDFDSIKAQIYDSKLKTWKDISFDKFNYNFNSYNQFVIDLFPYVYYDAQKTSAIKSGSPESAPAYLHIFTAIDSYFSKDFYFKIGFQRLGQGDLQSGKIDKEGYLWLACDFLAYPVLNQPQYYKFSNEITFEDPNQKGTVLENRAGCSPLVNGKGRDESYQLKTNIKFDFNKLNTLYEASIKK